MLTSPSSRYELRMNVNQQPPMASPYGQPQPGYGQPSYAPLGGGYPGPYGPYSGPATAYQPGAPQGTSVPLSLTLSLWFASSLLLLLPVCLCSSQKLACLLQSRVSVPVAKFTHCLSCVSLCERERELKPVWMYLIGAV